MIRPAGRARWRQPPSPSPTHTFRATASRRPNAPRSPSRPHLRDRRPAHITAEDAIPARRAGPELRAAPHRREGLCRGRQRERRPSRRADRGLCDPPRIVKVPQKSGSSGMVRASTPPPPELERRQHGRKGPQYRPYVQASFRNGYHAGLQLQSCFEAEIDIDGSEVPRPRVEPWHRRLSSRILPDEGCRRCDGCPARLHDGVELDGEHRQRPPPLAAPSASGSAAPDQLPERRLRSPFEVLLIVPSRRSRSPGNHGRRTATAPGSRCGAAATRAGAIGRNSPHGVRFRPGLRRLLGQHDPGSRLMPLGDAIRSGSPSPSIESKRNRRPRSRQLPASTTTAPLISRTPTRYHRGGYCADRRRPAQPRDPRRRRP